MAPSKSLSVSKLLQLSRPRFWMYVFGPYIVGLVAGTAQLENLRDWPIIAFAVYFLFPANILIYGVNDIFDYETDKDNAKKIEYETLVTPAERRALWRVIALTNTPFLLLLLFQPSESVIAMAAFWLFSIFYSATPIRAKAKPVLDSAFNILYIFPGIFAYTLAGRSNLSAPLIIAAWCWAMAMHAYSAVPDISADRQNGLQTVATFLGFRGTLWFCLFLYAASAILSFSTLKIISVLFGAIYIGMMLLSLTKNSESALLQIYKRFPLLNTLCGAVLFWAIVIGRFGHKLF